MLRELILASCTLFQSLCHSIGWCKRVRCSDCLRCSSCTDWIPERRAKERARIIYIYRLVMYKLNTDYYNHTQIATFTLRTRTHTRCFCSPYALRQCFILFSFFLSIFFCAFFFLRIRCLCLRVFRLDWPGSSSGPTLIYFVRSLFRTFVRYRSETCK